MCTVKCPIILIQQQFFLLLLSTPPHPPVVSTCNMHELVEEILGAHETELTHLYEQLFSFVLLCTAHPFRTQSQIVMMSQITGLMCL